MNFLSFSWDNQKNKANQKKHGISFEEAQTIFFDENAIEFADPDYSEDEDRFLMLGLSYSLHILIISYSLLEDNSEIKIIFARKATKKEQKVFIRRRL
jgi:uncharacterized DUF497 family protein